jgi:hypothetical protein
VDRQEVEDLHFVPGSVPPVVFNGPEGKAPEAESRWISGAPGTGPEQEGVVAARSEYETIAKSYRTRLAKVWPDAAVFFREDPSRRHCIEIRVVAEEWDPQRERTAHELMWLVPEANRAKVYLDVGVRFRKDGKPNLTGFQMV